jgi:hypothetical protein
VTPAQVIEQCREFSEMGFQRLIVMLPDVHEIRPLEIIGREVIPAVAKFETP